MGISSVDIRMNINPYKVIHITRTTVLRRRMFKLSKWTIEAWYGEITPFGNILDHAPTLFSVKTVLTCLPAGAITDITMISIMIDGVVHRMLDDEDWVMVILQEASDGSSIV